MVGETRGSGASGIASGAFDGKSRARSASSVDARPRSQSTRRTTSCLRGIDTHFFQPPAEEAEEDDDEAASRARVAPRGGEVPKEVFWHVLEYWQSSRD